jgi:hypothetical protein
VRPLLIGGQTLRQPILIFESVPAGTSKLIIKRQIRRPADLKKILMRFLPGQQNTLTVRPFIRKGGSGAVQELSAYLGNVYFAGDDNDIPFDLSFTLEQYDEFCIEVSNSSAYDYDVYVLAEIEYERGGN